MVSIGASSAPPGPLSSRGLALLFFAAFGAAQAGCFDISRAAVGDDTSAQPSVAVAQIAAAGDYSCALWQDGSVQCWGALAPGVASARARQIGLPSGVRKITVGDGPSGGHACALLEDRTVACWGANDRAQLGVATGVLEGSPEPYPIEGLYGVQDLWAGYGRTCALDAVGNLGCWGGEDRLLPSDKGASQEVFSPMAVSAGARDLCWLAAGQAVCKGVTPPALVGKPLMDLTGTVNNLCGVALEGPSATKVICTGISMTESFDSERPRQVASGETAVCALLDHDKNASFSACHRVTGAKNNPAEQTDPGDCADGPTGWSVRCWGAGPILASTDYSGVQNARQIAVGRDHACVLRGDDRVMCWGNNDQGQLGDGSTGPTASLVTVAWAAR